VDEVGFQALIGTVETVNALEATRAADLFQALIGTVETCCSRSVIAVDESFKPS